MTSEKAQEEMIMNVIRTRRSIRKYSDRPIDDETLLQILEAGLYAPSAVNFQPWYFVAVRTPEGRERLLKIMGGVAEDSEVMLNDRFKNHPAVVKEVKGFLKNLGNAPVCILAFQLKKEYPDVGNVISQSIGAAIENMLLAARAKGIGSCWIAAPSETGADRLIHDAFAPDKGPFAAMITLGYPEEQPREPRRKDGRFILV